MKPYYERGGVTIYNADCRDVLPYLADVHLVGKGQVFLRQRRQLAESSRAGHSAVRSRTRCDQERYFDMRCTRCTGPMLRVGFDETFRCLWCGHTDDPPSKEIWVPGERQKSADLHPERMHRNLAFTKRERTRPHAGFEALYESMKAAR